jgi:hypothetical protein
MADPPTFSLTAFNEADRLLASFEDIVQTAETVYSQLPEDKKDVFYQLALYPARAAMNVYKCNICVAWSAYLTEQGLPAAVEYADRARTAFEADIADMEYYNRELAGGKWQGIMRQNHLNYTAWNGPNTEITPDVMPKTGAVAPEARTIPPAPPSLALLENIATNTYVEPAGYGSINPARYTGNFAVGAYKWIIIDDYGRDGDSAKVLPNGKSFSVNSAEAPYLEFSFFIQKAGAYMINTFIAPTGNRIHQSIVPLLEQLRFSTQIDSEQRQTASGLLSADYKPGSGERTWAYGVMNNTRLVTTAGGELAAGLHTLRIYAVDPDVVLQKIVLAPESAVQTDISSAPPTYHFMGSYFGPPESHYKE